MVASRTLAAALLLALCASAAGREMLAKKPKVPKVTPYGANLYGAITKAGLTTLKDAIDASGLKHHFMDANLAATLMAPTEAAWKRYWNDCKHPPKKPADVAKYCSLDELKENKTQLREFIQYFILYGKATVEAGNEWWPVGRTFVKKPTLYNNNIMRLRYLAPYFEAHGTGRDANVTSLANLGCGKSLMHVVDNVITYSPLG